MSLYLRRKPSGALPPNTLKKKPSTAARKSTNSYHTEHTCTEQHQYQYQHQPWATGHLFSQHNNHAANPIAKSIALGTTHLDKKTSQPVANATMPTNRNSKPPGKTPLNQDEATDLITPLPSSTTRHSTSIHQLSYTTSPATGHSNVSLPARPPRKHTYSECFDLGDFAPGGTNQSQIRSPSGSLLAEIRSPSGNFLSAEQAAARADRPSGIRERQAAIRRKVREARERDRLGDEERAREMEERERVRVEELGLGNCVEVVGGVQGKQGKVKAKAKGEGKLASFCGCL